MYSFYCMKFACSLNETDNKQHTEFACQQMMQMIHLENVCQPIDALRAEYIEKLSTIHNVLQFA